MSGEWTDDPMLSDDEESLDDRIAEMKKREADQMPPWFLPVLGAGLVWVGIGLWLMHKLHWPQAYGYSNYCGVRGCIFLDMLRSPALLKHPTGTSIALFAWYMSAVAAMLGIIAHAARTKPRGQYLTLLVIIGAGFLVLALSPGGSVW